MADPARPTVPNAAGVPPVNPPERGPGTIAPDGSFIPEFQDPNDIVVVAQKTEDAPAVAKQTKPAWGIFNKKGGLALKVDSVREVEDDKEHNIPRYPIEGGGFKSYNKVETPQQVQVIVTKGGSTSDKASFISAVTKLCGSLDILTVVTPEQTYRSLNLVKNSKHRSAESGASLLVVQLTFEEVRVGSADAAFSDQTVKDPSGADNVSGGAVQTQTPQANQNPGKAPQ